jgi:circadian clock protein KaiB
MRRTAKRAISVEVVDIYQQPELAQGVQIVAVPTLVRVLPNPLRRFIGDLSSAERVLLGLDASVEAKALED